MGHNRSLTQGHNQVERQQLKNLLAQLKAALAETDELDPELERMAAEVDADLHRLVREEEPEDGLGERLDSLAADFAAKHPRTEAILRELADTLGKMGI